MGDNVEQLHVVLQQSFSPDASLRDPAEETIRNLKNIPGSTTSLLKIASEKQVGILLFCACIARAHHRPQSLYRSGDFFN